MQLTCRNTASIEGQICPKQMKVAGEFRLDDNIRILKLVILLGLGGMVSACASVYTATRDARFEP